MSAVFSVKGGSGETILNLEETSPTVSQNLNLAQEYIRATSYHLAKGTGGKFRCHPSSRTDVSGLTAVGSRIPIIHRDENLPTFQIYRSSETNELFISVKTSDGSEAIGRILDKDFQPMKATEENIKGLETALSKNYDNIRRSDGISSRKEVADILSNFAATLSRTIEQQPLVGVGVQQNKKDSGIELA